MSTTPPKSLLLALTKAKKASVLFIMAAEDGVDIGSSPRLDELCDEAGRKEADAFEALENWLHEK